MMGKTGLQIYTLRKIAQKDIKAAVELIAQAGYDGIEFDAGMLNRADASQLKTWMEQFQLSVIGLTLLLPEIKPSLSAMIDYALITGAEWIVMPWIDKGQRKDLADYQRVAAILNEAGRQTAAQGLRFAYHIHGYEFSPLGNSNGFDIFMAEMEPNFVELQVDTFWVASAGIDPVAFSRENIKRVGSFHIKDAASLDPMTDVEAGDGILNIPGIVNLGLKHEVGWFIVEQEQTQMPLFDSIRTSHNNLREMIKAARNSNTQKV
jgi:sugar phosphate isomerase/epimerase